MKKLIIIISIFQLGILKMLPSQTLTNNGAELTLNNGASVTINGAYRNMDGGEINNSGDIYITGSWINSATSGHLLEGTTGCVHFTGSSTQYIAGASRTWFNDLHIQNDVILNVETSVSDILLLDNATVKIGNNNFILQSGADISGASASSYIIAENNGRLYREVDNSNIVFPVGTQASYTPVSVNNYGTPDFYGIRVFADVLDGGSSGTTIPQIDNCVNMTWDIIEFIPGGSNLTVSTVWNASDEGTNFDRSQCGIGHYTNSAWNPQSSGSAIGSNPYARTRTGITDPGAIAVGDINSPMAVTLNLVVDISAFLEGPFNGTDMNSDLNPAYIPLSQPYNTPPWSYSGSESVGSIPNGDVVDWVLVELRDAADAASATPATTVEQQAAFILNTGEIVGLDGVSDLQFNSTINQNLFVVLWHRNHLGVMSANALTPSGGVYSYNFTTGESQAYGGVTGHKEIGTGIWGLIAGDGNADGEITLSDKSSWSGEAGKTGYLMTDYSMNGQVNNQDKNDILLNNLTSESQVPE